MEDSKFGPGDKVIVSIIGGRRVPGVVVAQEMAGAKPMIAGGAYRYRVDIAPEGKPCCGVHVLEPQLSLVERF